MFSSEWMPYRAAFGKGLAKGTCDQRAYWQQLIDELELHPDLNKNFSVLSGFIEEVDFVNKELVQEILDQCAQHSDLRKVLVDLHPWKGFAINDFNRCIAILNDSDISPFMYGAILWAAKYADLPSECILDLTLRLLNKPNGDDVVIDALSMKLHGKDESLDTLGVELRLLGIKAAIMRLKRDAEHSVRGDSDYHLECVIDAILRFDGNELEKLEWLDTIFDVIDNSYG
ncbi:TPA: hypothetical protein ACKRTE_003943, partial [Providencia rettgeri]